MKKHPQVITQGTNVLNFSQIRPFLGSLGCPQSFSLVLDKNSSPGPKNENFQKWKKHPQIFTQGTSVSNFSQIQPFLGSPGCPKVFGNTHTDRHTDRQTDRHSQILAQLKLRKYYYYLLWVKWWNIKHEELDLLLSFLSEAELFKISFDSPVKVMKIWTGNIQ